MDLIYDALISLGVSIGVMVAVVAAGCYYLARASSAILQVDEQRDY